MGVDIPLLSESIAFREAEDKSWLTTTCNTSLVDGKMEHYDQVVAISQGMINYALKRFHEQNPDMATFDGDNPLGTGTITGVLDPPQILVDVEERNVVIWRTNFKEGSLIYTAENGERKPHSINGWAVDVKVPLVMKDPIDKATDSEEEKATNAAQREWVRKCFQLPGDYSSERLYAKFADARWSDVCFAGKSFTINGKPESYDAWKRRSLENARLSLAFESTFKEICIARQFQGLTTIGTRFRLKDARIIPAERAALYPPVTMIHQGYPYRMPPSSGAPEEWQKGLTQFEDPGTRNCLLYCENTRCENGEIRTMQQRMLGLEGNFATIGGFHDPESRIEGTFSLSHQLFFERFLLPALQPFVRESQIFPREPTFDYKNASANNYSISEPYWIGHNPDMDSKEEGHTNKIYSFKSVVDPNGDGKRMCYQATVPNARDTAIKHNPRGHNYNKLWSDGTPLVTVRWKRGGTKIFVEGKTVYQTHITTAEHQNVDPGSHLLVPAKDWAHVTQTMTWDMEINVEAKDGSLHFTLEKADKPVSVVGKDDMNGWHWEIAGTTNKIRDDIESRISTHLKTLEETLEKAFEGQLRFNYPGYGQLEFKRSMFNEYGDFIASIRYADMPPPDPNNRIVIPPPLTQTPLAVTTTPTGGKTTGSPFGGATRLTWTGNSPVVASPPLSTGLEDDGKSEKNLNDTSTPGSSNTPTTPSPPVDRRVVFSIKGTNTTPLTQHFSQIKLNYSGNSKATLTLLRAVKFVLSGGRVADNQSVVELSIETSPDVTKLNNPQLQHVPLSSHMSDCVVTLTAGVGNVIAVPPGGFITVTAKSVSGSKGPKNYFVDVMESWCNAEGEVTPGAIDGFRARVPFKLV
ncbi:hypothetical protein F5Y03DRAFT_373909 [Xylaria venustula]|nr:hypothetical protein F5Y03DRAFT_373909 [Xylaria venustula]